MSEAHEVARPTVGRVVLRALGGLGGGAVAGALGGAMFVYTYTPHGGGPVGDWRAIFAWMGMASGGAVLGLLGGVVCGLTGFKLWKWMVVLLALGLAGGGVLIAAN